MSIVKFEFCTYFNDSIMIPLNENCCLRFELDVLYQYIGLTKKFAQLHCRITTILSEISQSVKM